MIHIGSADAVEKQLDQLETIVNVFVLSALVVLWAAADVTKEFDLLGMKVSTEDAYGIVVAFFAGVFLIVLHLCWKTADLIETVDLSDCVKAITTLFTHKWIFTPFAYTGRGVISLINCSLAAGLLVFWWWFGCCALALLGGTVDLSGDTFAISLTYCYVIFGILSVVAIGRVYWVVWKRVDGRITSAADAATLRGGLRRSLIAKGISAAVASAFGAYLYYEFTHIGA